MCTVTLSALTGAEKGFVLTSNRDEAVRRKTLPPREYSEKGVRMLYPKDELAGGSWIGLSERSRAICLLNGGFEKHERKPPYRMSRGQVVKDLLVAEQVLEEIQAYDLEGIEAFTCVIVDFSTDLFFYELVWDGHKKHQKQLPPGNYIWSSSLLYSEEVRADRSARFQKFQAEHELKADTLLSFHGAGGAADREGLIIDRGFLKTCSITQVTNSRGRPDMFYQNLLQQEAPVRISFSQRE